MPTVSQINAVIEDSHSINEITLRLNCSRDEIYKYSDLCHITLPLSTQGRRISEEEIRRVYENGGIGLVCDTYQWDRTNARKKLRRIYGKPPSSPKTY